MSKPVMATLVAALLLNVSTTSAQHSQQEQLGAVRFPTSCRADVAPDFNRGVALLHSFQFGDAIQAFTAIVARDSSCAMAWWGLAMSRWTNPFLANNRPATQLTAGRTFAQRASALSNRASDRERGYIEAVNALYADFENTDQRSRVLNYERAMRALVIAQPQDTEAVIFHAISLSASALPTDKTYARQLEAGGVLEALFKSQPNHPGLAHYIIHSYDIPPLAAKAESAAVRYASIAPSASHAQHMPSHTFTRVGWWDASVRTNQRAIEVAKTEGSFGEALHASDYMEYANLQMGKDAAARAVVDAMPALAAKFDPNAIGAGGSGPAGVFAIAAAPARFALERRQWAEAVRLVPRATNMPWTEAMTYFARALGAAHTGELAVARASIDSLARIRERLTQSGEAYYAEQAAIQGLGAQAWLAWAERRTEDALRLMREAAAREDATEKNAVTPGPLAPARELLGDMLFELKQPAAALAEYRTAMRKEPNRFRLLYGAMRAASASGDRDAAEGYRRELLTLCAQADSPGRPELKEIRAAK